MVLRNFVTLQNNVPAVMHFTDHVIAPREITDPLTNRPKTINVLEFQVDELNGGKVSASFSVTSEKLAKTLEPLLPNRDYLTMNVIITKTGSGFNTDYSLQTARRS